MEVETWIGISPKKTYKWLIAIWFANIFPQPTGCLFTILILFLAVQICLVWYQAQLLSYVWLFVTPWTVACQAPLSMGLSQQEYWIRLPFPPPRDLLDPRIKPADLELLQLLHWQADSLSLSHLGSPLVWCGPIYFVFLPVLLMSYCHWHNPCLWAFLLFLLLGVLQFHILSLQFWVDFVYGTMLGSNFTFTCSYLYYFLSSTLAFVFLFLALWGVIWDLSPFFVVVCFHKLPFSPVFFASHGVFVSDSLQPHGL